MRRPACSAPLCLAAALSLSVAAHAQGAPVSFNDKAITLLIGNAAGGGTDLYGRTLGQFLVAHLPGAPKLVVINQPGAEGVIALNSFYMRAKPDGLTVTFGAGTQSDPLFYRSAHAVYDLAKLEYAGGIGRSGAVLAISGEAMPRLSDKSAPPVTMGALAAVRPSMYMALWGGEYLGWNMRWVLGYPSTAVLRQALERGEVDMTMFATMDDILGVTKTGRFAILAQLGTPSQGRLVPRPEFGDAPILADLVAPRITDPVAQEAFAYWKSVAQIANWLALPPGTPEPIVAAYQAAMHAALDDPELHDKTRRLAPDAVEMSGPQVKVMLTGLAATPPEVLAWLQALQKREGLPVAE